VQIGALTDWSQISDELKNAISIKTDGTLWTWGNNDYGQLGLGNKTSYSSPKQIGALTTWAQCEAGSDCSFAIKTDGTLWSWGFNPLTLGLGNTTSYSSPVQVGALTNWLKISSANNNVLAIKTDGTMWGWGINDYRQLGDGTISSRSFPTQVGNFTNGWSDVVVSNSSAVALKTNGTLWTWGSGSGGKLGHGVTTNEAYPRQVGALTTWAAIAATGLATIAVKTDGTLWSWGYGTVGQLGSGSTVARSSPVQVGALTTWSKVSAGQGSNCYGTQTDGTLWAWGLGTYGQLGLGNTTNYSSPKQVGSLTTWITVSAGENSCHAIRT
jgi:alpha-tubulin suppressor-like RCC1 family protein